MSVKKSDPLAKILESIYELHRVIRQELCDERHGHAVNLLQLHVLLLLSEHKGMTMKELAEAMHVSSPSATSFVERLVRLHWVRRHRDAHNRKLVRLSLTSVGATALAQMQAERKKAISGIIGLLSKSEQREFAALHEKLLRKILSRKSFSH